MTQQPLFCSSYREALVAAVSALGGNKVVAHMLWPTKEPDVAADLLAKCLNQKKREKLAPEQVAFIRRECRENNIHVLAAWEMQDAGYAPPVAVEPEDEKADLHREVLAVGAKFETLVARLEALHAKPARKR